jgi:hypothetical protein
MLIDEGEKAFDTIGCESVDAKKCLDLLWNKPSENGWSSG